MYDGKKYNITKSAEDFIESWKKGKLAAFAFLPDNYFNATKPIILSIEKIGINPSQVYDSTKWICRTCLQELPSSFVMSTFYPGGMIIIGGNRSSEELNNFNRLEYSLVAW